MESSHDELSMRQLQFGWAEEEADAWQLKEYLEPYICECVRSYRVTACVRGVLDPQWAYLDRRTLY